MRNKSNIFKLIALFGVILGLGACSSVGDNIGEYNNNKTLPMTVKTFKNNVERKGFSLVSTEDIYKKSSLNTSPKEKELIKYTYKKDLPIEEYSVVVYAKNDNSNINLIEINRFSPAGYVASSNRNPVDQELIRRHYLSNVLFNRTKKDFDFLACASNDDFLKYDTECEKGKYLVSHSGKTSAPVIFSGDVRDYYATIIIKPNY